MKHKIDFKLFLTVLLCCFSFQINLFAQSESPEKRAKNLTLSMNCELGLFDAQIPVINAINLEAAQRMDSARHASGSDMKTYHKAGQNINKDRNIKLRDVLTPKQWAIYEPISRGDRRALRKTSVCRTKLQMD